MITLIGITLSPKEQKTLLKVSNSNEEAKYE